MRSGVRGREGEESFDTWAGDEMITIRAGTHPSRKKTLRSIVLSECHYDNKSLDSKNFMVGELISTYMNRLSTLETCLRRGHPPKSLLSLPMEALNSDAFSAPEKQRAQSQYCVENNADSSDLLIPGSIWYTSSPPVQRRSRSGVPEKGVPSSLPK